MRVLSVITIVVLFSVSSVAQSPPGSFYSAKKFLAEVHEEIRHMETIYRGCPYDRTTVSGGDVDRDACRLEARNTEHRSDRVEWEHVVPASWFGQTRACWQLTEKAYPEECEGKSGRECCQAVNDWFDIAHNDPNNLFPSSGEVSSSPLRESCACLSFSTTLNVKPVWVKSASGFNCLFRHFPSCCTVS